MSMLEEPGNIASYKTHYGVLTVSDSCSQGTAKDESGKNLCDLITSSEVGGILSQFECIRDDILAIQQVLKLWSDSGNVDVILTTGGTGFSERDVTPEATKSILHKEAPGLVIAMMRSSLNITPMAALSRQVCGIRKQTVIINLPGSKKAAEECFRSILRCLPHAVALIRNDQISVKKVHKEVQGHMCHHGHTKSGVDVSRVARRKRESSYPLVSVTEAQTIVLEQCEALEIESVNYMEVFGRVLSENVHAVDPLPPFPASIKDGYAVIASDEDGRRLVIGDSTAGSNPSLPHVTPGYCLRISTGAPIPHGADSVIQVEDTELLQETDDGKTEVEIRVLKKPQKGQDIRAVGSDIAVGENILPKGIVLGASEIGILATVGVMDVDVHRLPKVGVLSTGNELQDPGLPLAEGHIRDSNRATLLALLKEHGIQGIDVGIAVDTPDAVLSKLEEGLSHCDVLVTTGGASMGEKDLMKEVLIEDLKATVHFGRVFMKPGKPTIFATVNFNGKKKLIFCLPGNPVSATVTSYLYVLPACRKLAGYTVPKFTTIKAKINSTIDLDPRPEYCRVKLMYGEGEVVPVAETTGNQISSRLLSCCGANALLCLPPRKAECTSVLKLTEVDAIVIGRL